MQVKGYSERGVVNALIYEILYHHEPLRVLTDLLAQASFPFAPSPDLNIVSAQYLIEQSLSDFGDADAIGLIETPSDRFTLFLEAKVKAAQRAEWSIESEWDEFKMGSGSSKGLSSSNLFTQLYHKVRLFQALCADGKDSLSKGLNFPPCSSKSFRKIGNNPVLIRAVDLILAHRPLAYFLALVPDNPDHMSQFFADTLKGFAPSDFPGWDVSRWGYLCWSTVEAFCRRQNLTNTLEVLEFNSGQVY